MQARPLRCSTLSIRAPWGALRAETAAAEPLGGELPASGGLMVGVQEGEGTGALRAEPAAAEPFAGGLPAGAALLLGFQEGEGTEMRAMILELCGSRVVRCNDADLSLPVSALLAGDGGGDGDASGQRIVVFVNDGDADTEALMEKMDEDPDPRGCLVKTSWLNSAELGATLGQLADSLVAEHDAEWRLCEPLATHASEWDPSDPALKLALHLELDGAHVFSRLPSGAPAQRWDAGRVVVLDGFLDDALRQALLAQITALPWDRVLGDLPEQERSMGLTAEGLEALCGGEPSAAVLEVQTRLALLFPHNTVARMSDMVLGDEVPPIVCNAPEAGESFEWHIDADPGDVPPSPWRDRHGMYYNREPGKPRLVSALVYLDDEWPLEWGGETLFLDPGSATGALVRPAPGRLILMDQDVTHRVSAPSPAAGRPRYSMVWKLAVHPAAG
ncbi:hypothetical protein T484DRAFT_1661647, partial [Baffinella frigidus]